MQIPSHAVEKNRKPFVNGCRTQYVALHKRIVVLSTHLFFFSLERIRLLPANPSRAASSIVNGSYSARLKRKVQVIGSNAGRPKKSPLSNFFSSFFFPLLSIRRLCLCGLIALNRPVNRTWLQEIHSSTKLAREGQRAVLLYVF